MELGGRVSGCGAVRGELDLPLRDVDPLGLRHEDAAAQQLERLFELLVGPTQLVTLGDDARKCLLCRGELRTERGEVLAYFGAGCGVVSSSSTSRGNPAGACFSSAE
jgi:hypothetical protein